MAINRFKGDFFVVFADNCQQNAQVGQGFEGALECDKSFAFEIMPPQLEVFPAIIADNPAPKGVIEVNNN